MSKVFELFPVTGFRTPTQTLFGIECEIESVRNAQTTWTITEDGSLRNNGREFISPPIGKADAVEGFDLLHEQITIHKEFPKFSDRTSIHVHVNCQHLDEMVVRNIIYMYALYEEFFFRMATPDRKHNIHCVPLTETHLPTLYRMSLTGMVERWHKYTALNIKPLGKYGTIEFRHMHGHDDTRLFSEWLDVLDNLFKLAADPAGRITKETISVTNLDRWFDTIFAGTRVSSLKPQLKELTYNQRLDIKLMLSGN